MRLVRPFGDHSDVYLTRAATKLESFSSGVSHKERFLFQLRVGGGREGQGEQGRRGAAALLFFLHTAAATTAAAVSKQKTSQPDKRLSGHPATLISECPPKRPRRSIQYIKVEVKYCRVGNKAHNN